MDNSRPGYYWDHLECRWERCPAQVLAGDEIPTQQTTVEEQPEVDVLS